MDGARSLRQGPSTAQKQEAAGGPPPQKLHDTFRATKRVTRSPSQSQPGGWGGGHPHGHSGSAFLGPAGHSAATPGWHQPSQDCRAQSLKKRGSSAFTPSAGAPEKEGLRAGLTTGWGRLGGQRARGSGLSTCTAVACTGCQGEKAFAPVPRAAPPAGMALRAADSWEEGAGGTRHQALRAHAGIITWSLFSLAFRVFGLQPFQGEKPLCLYNTHLAWLGSGLQPATPASTNDTFLRGSGQPGESTPGLRGRDTPWRLLMWHRQQKNPGPRRYCSLLHGVTSVNTETTAEARGVSYRTNTLASISGLLCLSEIAGSRGRPDPSSPVGRDRSPAAAP